MLSFSMRPAKYFYDKPLPKYLDPKTVLIYRPHPVYTNDSSLSSNEVSSYDLCAMFSGLAPQHPTLVKSFQYHFICKDRPISENKLSFDWRTMNDLWRAMLFRRPMIWFLAPALLPSVSWFDPRHTGRLRKRDNLMTGEGERGAESFKRKKVWSYVNHSILSV